MNAEIVAVGSELLTPQRMDTNSLWLTEQLNMLGVEVTLKCVVGDDRPRLTAAISAALARTPIVIVTGGLGPTEDDVTRDAVAASLGRPLVFSQEIADGIAERFRKFGRKMAEINLRQAYLVDGGEALDNPNGTAPGQWIEDAGRMVMLLPGPPKELKPMFAEHCLPRLQQKLPPQFIRTRFYRVAMMGESDLDALIAPAYTKYENPVTTVLAAPGDVQVHLRARCATAEEAEALCDELGSQVEALLGDRIYSTDGAKLEEAVGRLLRAAGATVAVAESCTGGLLAHRLTAVSGSSDYVLGGFVTYTNAIKTQLLGIAPDLIRDNTAVSEPVAAAMAEAAQARTGATWAIGITGEAGPVSSTGAKVGTVMIGFAGPREVTAKTIHLFGDRERIRQMAAQSALEMLRRQLMPPL
ncbi:MAG: competence/damage-inducible protein A [Bryobacteraceae bacterium]